MAIYSRNLLESIPGDPEIYLGDHLGVKPIGFIGALRTTRDRWHTQNPKAQGNYVSLMHDTGFYDVSILNTYYNQ